LIADLTPNANEVEESSVVSSLFILKDLASKVVYSKIIGFMRYILNNSNKKEILFSNVLTEEEINKRYRKLAFYFHPDKTSSLCIPTVLQEDYKNLGIQLFKDVLEFRNSLLYDLNKSSKIGNLMKIHEEKADKLWKIAIDYRNAHKEQWGKLKLLKEEDLRKTPSKELKSTSIFYGQKAYEEYRTACKLADKYKQLTSQIKLRGYMALSLYISGKFLEAQLYALSAIKMIYRNPSNVTQQDLLEAKQIFDKVKGSDSNEGENTPQLNTEINPKYNSCSSLVKTETLDDEYSFFEEKAIYRSIKDDLEKISFELLIKADRSLASRKEILRTERHAKIHKAAGINTMVVATATTAIVGAVNAMAIGSGIGGPVLGVFARISMLVFGIWGGSRRAQLLKERTTCEALNKIIEKAVLAYDEGDYQKFFAELCKKYEYDKSLLKIIFRGDSIDHKGIINELIKHGFRPDGIAYLLNLIGEVFISGKIKFQDITTEELKSLGCNVLCGVLSNELEHEAKTLDNRFKELREKSIHFHLKIMSE
jgi:hypothetical protein